MNKTIVTCAVTGNITRPDQHPALPITPKQIADASIGAANAGASIVHIHVRDPETGAPSMAVSLYKEVVDRIREVNSDVIINLTTGPGGRYVPSEEDPRKPGPGTTLLPPDARVEHIMELRPDICSLDLNTMNSGDQVVINTPTSVKRMAELIRQVGVTPEYEIFDSGDISLALDLIADGDLNGPGLWSFVTGIKYGFRSSCETLQYATRLLPEHAIWTAFGIGRHEFQMAAQTYLLGGHVRVGFEDNLYIRKGILAESNAALVERAVQIVDLLGGAVASAKEARGIIWGANG